MRCGIDKPCTHPMMAGTCWIGGGANAHALHGLGAPPTRRQLTVSAIVGERAQFLPADPCVLMPPKLGHILRLLERAHAQFSARRQPPRLFRLKPFGAGPRCR